MAWNYSIGSPRGQEIANNMNNGDTYKASDGSTWTKNSDGSISVTTQAGNTTANAYQATSKPANSGGSAAVGSTSGGSSTSTPKTNSVGNYTSTSGNYSFGSQNGQTIFNDFASGNITQSGTVADASGNKSNYTYNADGSVTLGDGATLSKDANGNVVVTSKAGNKTVYSSTPTQNANSNAYNLTTYKGQNYYDQLMSGKLSSITSDMTSDGSTWAVENGNVVVTSKDGTKRIAQKIGTPTDVDITEATDSAGKKYSIIKTKGGDDILEFSSEDGEEVAPGKITLNIGGKTNQYIVSRSDQGQITLAQVDNSYPPLLMDRNTGEEVSFKDVNGNLINSSNLAFCTDGIIRSTHDGRMLKDLTGDTAGTSAYVVRVGDSFYSVNDGSDVTEMINPALFTRQWTLNKDEMINALLSELRDQGFIKNPQISDYDALSWEQALAQASNQLGMRYDQNMNGMLDNLNQQALRTGFYGQLPTEALKQQAMASAEVDKQAAIFDLASNLMGNSRDYAQQLYEDDTATNKDRLNTLSAIIDYLYQDYENEMAQARTQQEAQAATDNFKRNALQYAVTAMKNGIPVSALNQYIGNIA